MAERGLMCVRVAATLHRSNDGKRTNGAVIKQYL